MAGAAIQHKYIPRALFMPFHERQQRYAVLVCHRRAGKTVAVINDMVIRALRTQKKEARYAYIAPYAGQVKQIAWSYLVNAVGSLPGAKINSTESKVRLPNGSEIRLYGADNFDALRGIYLDGVCLDEFGDMRGTVWTEVIRPTLSDRRGWAVFIGTPKGKNKFFEMREQARNDDGKRWLYLDLKASETGYLPPSELVDLRQDLDEDEYAQEYECSFEAANRGSYYGKQMRALLRSVNRLAVPDEIDGDRVPALRRLPYVAGEPVSLAMDIGRADALAIWFWQVINGEVRFFDYFEQSGLDAGELCDILELRPYRYETWWLPHDARSRTFASKKSVMDTFIERDAPARIAPTLDVNDGVQAVRKTLRTYPVAFDEKACYRGLEALRNYSHKWDPDRKVHSNKPEHDEWSHGADAFRYACLAIKREAIDRSIEKALEKKSGRAGGPVLNNRITFQQALDEHDRHLAAQRSAGRQRI